MEMTSFALAVCLKCRFAGALGLRWADTIEYMGVINRVANDVKSFEHLGYNAVGFELLNGLLQDFTAAGGGPLMSSMDVAITSMGISFISDNLRELDLD